MGSGQTGAASGAAAAGAPATARGGGDEELDLLDAVGGGVVASAQQLARSLLEKEAAVQRLRGQGAVLRQALRDQDAVTERAAREALLTRARLRGAQRAILAAEAREREEQGATAAGRRADALRARDAARRAAAEAQLRVEVLEDPAGQALRRRHAQAGALVAQVAVELGSLEEQVRALAAAGAQLQEVAAGDDPDRQEQNLERRTAQLEARWAGLAGRLDMIASGRTAIPATTLGSGPPLTRPLFLDTEESFNTFHRLCLDIQEVCSLLKKN
ncbi:uncharacterized protein LOC113210207 isoform X1 [Frankliniella occidentalis]|uniref:Uncharacterized protein LOC113210207 isoform X1 n=1 Tax=Frankliniella occidentalis TaxID=133901 RepID=A0A9C6U151_FRAOC|nr:uncharacterized protein LOC113210207 isoform X1 [Frankliniella occidentalis]